jgi:hypothetical protein
VVRGALQSDPASSVGRGLPGGPAHGTGLASAAFAARQIPHDTGIDPAPRRSGPAWRRFPTAQAHGPRARGQPRGRRAAQAGLRAEPDRARHPVRTPVRAGREPGWPVDHPTGPAHPPNPRKLRSTPKNPTSEPRRSMGLPPGRFSTRHTSSRRASRRAGSGASGPPFPAELTPGPSAPACAAAEEISGPILALCELLTERTDMSKKEGAIEIEGRVVEPLPKELHSDPAGGPGRRRAQPVRPDARADRVPVQVIGHVEPLRDTTAAWREAI